MTITPPANINYGTVTWRSVMDIEDGPDAGDAPDYIAPTFGSTVTFEATSPRLIDAAIPLTVLRVPVVAVIDSAGYLCTPLADGSAGARGIKLIATDDPDLNPTGWLYRVTYSIRAGGRGVASPPTHLLAVPQDTTVDLSTVIPPDAATPLGVAQAEAAALRAEAAALALSTAVDALSTAVGTKVNSGTYTAGQAAQDAVIASKVAHERTVFAGKSSVPTTADTGQPASTTGSGSWVMADGGMRMGAGVGGAAVYWQRDLGAQVTTLLRRFRYATGSGTTDGQGLLIGAFSEKFVDVNAVSSSVHGGIDRNGWFLQTIEPGTVFTTLASGTFSTPLALGVIHESAMSIDGDTVTWRLPDGNVITIRDPKIATLGRRWAIDEITSVDRATDRKLELVESAHGTALQPPIPRRSPIWTPADNGLVAYNFDPREMKGGLTLSNLSRMWNMIPLRAGETATKLVTYCSIAGANLADTDMAIYENTNRLATTGSLTSVLNSTGLKTMTLDTPIAAKPYDRKLLIGARAGVTTGTSFPQLGSSQPPGFAYVPVNLGLTTGPKIRAGYFYTGTNPAFGSTTIETLAMTSYYDAWFGLA